MFSGHRVWFESGITSNQIFNTILWEVLHMIKQRNMNITEKYCTQGFNTMYFGESTCNISPPFLGSSKNPAKVGVKLMNQVYAYFCWFLVHLTLWPWGISGFLWSMLHHNAEYIRFIATTLKTSNTTQILPLSGMWHHAIW